jgi:cell wall-associated NlpC family hydrolase
LGFTASLRALGISALAAVSILTVAAPTVAASGSTTSVTTAATRVVRIAEAQRGKRYALGAAGPSAFDCSGLVRYAYSKAGVSSHLGGGHSAYAMLRWARAHHEFSRTNPQVGDVVIYGNGSHAAIYIGHGKVISALNPRQGIRITGLHALSASVTGFIHTHLSHLVKVTRPHHVPTSTASTTGSVVRTRVYANLRAAASTSSRILAVVRPGVAVRVVGAMISGGRRWDHIVYAGHRYWVRADLVRAA